MYNIYIYNIYIYIYIYLCTYFPLTIPRFNPTCDKNHVLTTANFGFGEAFDPNDVVPDSQGILFRKGPIFCGKKKPGISHRCVRFWLEKRTI